MTDITKVCSYEELPPNARRYLERITEIVNVQLALVAVGPKRDQTIVRAEIF